MVELIDIERIVRESNTGLVDPRGAHARARLDGGRVWIEASDAAWLEAAVARVRDAGVEARGRLLYAPADRIAWVAASVAEVRREPRHAAEQVTQVLQGEALQPLVHEDGWLLARLADGYVGWVRDWHLRFVAPQVAQDFRARADARIAANQVTLRTEPRADADASGDTVLGTAVVTAGDERGWTRIELPGGDSGWVRQQALRAGTGSWPRTHEALLATVRRFVGVPYLWGGKSPKGFDCSGLVQFVFGLHGMTLPRDSDQQAVEGDAVEVPAACDLVFFGRERVTHVAIAEGPGTFLHARGAVRRNSTVAGRPAYDGELWALRCGIRRVFDPDSTPQRG